VDDVCKATSKDTLLSLVRTAIQTGQWSSSELKPFKPIKDELSIDYTNNVVLRGTRLVIPSSLVQRVIQLAHEGHQGQAKTKALIREHVWFPEMDKKVRAELEKCLACQATGQPSQPEPLRSTPLPNKAWDKLKIEAFMKPLGKAIRTANLEGRPWKQELSKFLLAYRSTPHSTTKVPPAQLLYNREIRGKLPTLRHNSKVINRHREAKQNDKEQKQRGKRYTDSRRHTRTSKLRVGGRVLVRQKKTNKFSTNFSPTPYTIVAIKWSKVVARNQQHFITRNNNNNGFISHISIADTLNYNVFTIWFNY
jgi:hypothetical protein